MAAKKFDDPEVRRAVLKLAKNKPMAFAVVLGAKPVESVLAVDKKLSPDLLFKGLKKEAGLTRGTFGTVSIEGRVATFTAEKVPSALTRVLRVLLKAEKLPYVPVVPGDDDPGEETDGAVETASVPAPGMTADGLDATPVGDAGDAPAPAPAADTRPLLAALNQMSPAIKAAVAADPSAKAEILPAVATVKRLIDEGDAAAAKEALLQLGQRVKAAGRGAASGGASGGGGKAAGLAPAIAAWKEASESVDGQIDALQKALRATRDAGFEQIAEFGLNGITGRHRVTLQTALIEVQGAAPEAVAARAGAARAAAAAYRGFLETDEVAALVDENPFVRTTIRKTLGDALTTLEGSLAAAS